MSRYRVTAPKSELYPPASLYAGQVGLRVGDHKMDGIIYIRLKFSDGHVAAYKESQVTKLTDQPQLF